MKTFFISNLILCLLCKTTNTFSQLTDSTLHAMTSGYSDYIGKVVYLNFWATSCGPCRAAIPSEKKLYKRIRKRYKEFVWINISTDTDVRTWQRFLKKNTLPGKNVIIGKFGDVESLFHVDRYPTYILISKEGRIIGHDIAGADEAKGILLEYLIYRGLQNIKSGDALREFLCLEPVANEFMLQHLKIVL